MPRLVYRYRFAPALPLDEAKDTLSLALIAAESLHGEAQVCLDAEHHFDHDTRVCHVDASTEVGIDVNRLFTGFLRREFGSDAFAAERSSEESVVPASA
jgi:hypothetical protein